MTRTTTGGGWSSFLCYAIPDWTVVARNGRAMTIDWDGRISVRVAA